MWREYRNIKAWDSLSTISQINKSSYYPTTEYKTSDGEEHNDIELYTQYDYQNATKYSALAPFCSEEVASEFDDTDYQISEMQDVTTYCSSRDNFYFLNIFNNSSDSKSINSIKFYRDTSYGRVLIGVYYLEETIILETRSAVSLNFEFGAID